MKDRGSEDELDAEVEDDDDSPPHQVHFAMSAMKSMQSSEDSLEFQTSAHTVNAVTAGVSLLEDQTPKTFRAAMSSPDAAKWRDAMDKEIGSCEALKVWNLVRRSDLPSGANILPPKWVYKIKTDEAGNVIQHKARVTPKGFLQKLSTWLATTIV